LVSCRVAQAVAHARGASRARPRASTFRPSSVNCRS
jgi:hypothetical protein